MTDPDRSDVVISAVAGVPDEPLAEFRDSLAGGGLSVEEERRSGGPYAGIEWALPTAIVLFLTRKLFDSFMSEAGKDLYQLVKRALIRLTNRTTGPRREVHVRYVGTPGKVSTEEAPALSVYVRIGPRRKVKFIFTNDLSEEDQTTAVAALLEILGAHHSGATVLTDSVSAAKLVQGGTVPFVFDPVVGDWRLMSERDLLGPVKSRGHG